MDSPFTRLALYKMRIALRGHFAPTRDWLSIHYPQFLPKEGTMSEGVNEQGIPINKAAIERDRQAKVDSLTSELVSTCKRLRTLAVVTRDLGCPDAIYPIDTAADNLSRAIGRLLTDCNLNSK